MHWINSSLCDTTPKAKQLIQPFLGIRWDPNNGNSMVISKSTEILSLATLQWRSGPDLPGPIYGAAAVSTEIGGWLVGGGRVGINQSIKLLFN
jgi:hypothetical protein